MKNKIIGAKVIKKEEDLLPILKEGTNAIPTEKDFNLSEKIKEINVIGEYLIPKHVKEFIKIIEGIIIRNGSPRQKLNELRKRAGEKLI